MKKLITTLTLFTALSTYAQNKTADLIRAQEYQKNFEKAFAISINEAQRIAYRIKTDQVVETVKSRLNEIRKEAVTQTQTTSAKINFLNLFSGGFSDQTILTDIQVMNPNDVSGFSEQIQNDLAKLNSSIRNYISSNKTALVEMKLLTAKSIDLYMQMSPSYRANYSSELKSVIQKSQAINFYGRQDISHCISTEYLAQTRTTGGSVSGFLISLSLEQTVVKNAQTIVKCVDDTAMTMVPDTEMKSSELLIADIILAKYQKTLGLVEVVDLKPEYTPTWGL